jgi:uncharacterized protein (DUF2235 family)
MKRLVVCCDGTWNFADQSRNGEACPTNVTQVHRAVADTGDDGVVQQKTYHEGVGVRRFQRVRGGAGGYGLSRHVRDAYTWLVRTFEPGDEIFLFGFSRGAYTARSVVGLIRTCGILRPEEVGRVKEAYGLYRKAHGVPDMPEALSFRAEHAEETRIRFLGVWDTVGALGIPLSGVRFVNVVNRRFTFHNVTLSSRVDAAYQALAVDERRGPFAPAVWRQSEEGEGSTQRLEQVWFAGVHSDVGGGYADRRLADLALQWMADRATAEGLTLHGLPEVQVDDHTAVESTVHDSYRGFYRWLKPYHRVIGMTDPAHEAVASSTTLRLRAREDYRPPGLLSYLAVPQVTDVGPTASAAPGTAPPLVPGQPTADAGITGSASHSRTAPPGPPRGMRRSVPPPPG